MALLGLAVCESALERELSLRAAFVAEACGVDETLRCEVEPLLARWHAVAARAGECESSRRIHQREVLPHQPEGDDVVTRSERAASADGDRDILIAGREPIAHWRRLGARG